MATKYSRSSRGLVAAALAVISAGALAGEITLYQNRDFRGEAVTLQGPVMNLEQSGFQTASSAVVRSGLWEACTSANFSGRCIQLQPGEYRNVNTLLNDDIASTREITFGASVPAAAVVAGVAPAPVIVAAAPAPATVAAVPAPVIVATRDPRIVLYQDRGFGGTSVELTKTMGGLERSADYSGANAAVVYGGVWRLCSRQYFRGECADFAPGQYADLGTLRGHVASAELVAVTSTATVGTVAAPVVAGQVLLYDSPNFRGQSVAIDGGAVRDLHVVGFVDCAASMRIVSGTWMFCTDSDFRGECRTMGPGEYAHLPRDVDRRIASIRRLTELGAL